MQEAVRMILPPYSGVTGNANERFGNREELDEKLENREGTYKRGDLLKMHTYNDLPASTIGSCALPGSTVS